MRDSWAGSCFVASIMLLVLLILLTASATPPPASPPRKNVLVLAVDDLRPELNATPPPASPPRKNVLMLAVDDLRPELNAYGFSHIHSPNIDALAARGTTFARAYVQVAVCMPSRQAILTSRRPDTTMGWTISPQQTFRRCGGRCGANTCSSTVGGGCGIPDLVTLPGWFYKNGYLTIGAGKIFHEGADTDLQDWNYSWTPSTTVGPPTGIWDVGSDEDPRPDPVPTNDQAIFAFPDAVKEEQLLDGRLAAHVVQLLANISRAQNETAEAGGTKQPFFVGAGFHRPHVPWRVPEKYFELYPLETVDLAPHVYPPKNVPLIALQNVMGGWSRCQKPAAPGGLLGTGPFTDLCNMCRAANFSQYSPMFPFENRTYPAHISKLVRQAYWAAISYTDAQIGKVLRALKDYGLEQDTVVALWGDHGYQLGDNDEWSKQTNFEHATRIPLIVALPPGTAGVGAEGIKSDALVESVDIYPTLVEASSGQRLPQCPPSQEKSRTTAACTEGFSLLPLITSPSSSSSSSSSVSPSSSSSSSSAVTHNRTAAHSQFPRDCSASKGAPCNKDDKSVGVMGYTMRVDEWRYTAWVRFNYTTASPDWNTVYGRELYSHVDSPVPRDWAMEHDNVVDDPEHAGLVTTLHDRLLRCAVRPDLC